MKYIWFITVSIFALQGSGYSQDLAGSSFDDPFAEEVPIVLTAARMKQPQSEAPAAVTIITKEMIRESGVRSLLELFRLVPGMSIYISHVRADLSGVTYHGFNEPLSARLQVLIDGRSIFQQALARVYWTEVPVSLEDIERIEVIRGPNGAAYGANAFLGVINIITRNPVDTQGAAVSGTMGERSIKDGYFRFGSKIGNMHFRISGNTQEDDGFDHGQQETFLRHDDQEAKRFNFRGIIYKGKHTIDLHAGTAKGIHQNQQSMLEIEPQDWTVQQSYGMAKWTCDINDRNQLTLQTFFTWTDSIHEWRVDLSSVSPQLEGITGAANNNSKEDRFDIELQHTFTPSDRLTLVTGMNYRKDEVESQTFFGGKGENTITRAYGHLRWLLAPQTILNLGAMLESEDLVGDYLSPRVSINHHIGKHHTFRVIVSKGIRTPDMFEQNAIWSYTVTDLEYFGMPIEGTLEFPSGLGVPNPTGPGDLVSEEILAYELGYYLRIPSLKLEMDTKLFFDELDQLIYSRYIFDEFAIENSGTAESKGFETQITFHLSDQIKFYGSYGYLDFDSDDGQGADYNRNAPKSNGSFMIHWLPNSKFSWASNYYFVDRANKGFYPVRDIKFHRWDNHLRFVKDFSKVKLMLSGVLQLRLNDKPITDEINHYADRTGYYFKFGLQY